MTNRRRELRILGWHSAIGGVVVAVMAGSGLLFTPNLWATLGGLVMGAWVGLAIYRLRSDSLF